MVISRRQVGRRAAYKEDPRRPHWATTTIGRYTGACALNGVAACSHIWLGLRADRGGVLASRSQ
jgi:hypothetical protein